MSIEDFFRHPVVRRRAGTRAGRGSDLVADWDTPDDLDLLVWMSPIDTADTRDTNTGKTTRWRMSAPADADVVAGDRIVYQGEVLHVVGAPVVQPDADGPHHMVCKLESREG